MLSFMVKHMDIHAVHASVIDPVVNRFEAVFVLCDRVRNLLWRLGRKLLLND